MGGRDGRQGWEGLGAGIEVDDAMRGSAGSAELIPMPLRIRFACSIETKPIVDSSRFPPGLV
jgi:hypothetical protein